MKKYKLTDECITIGEHKLYRIEALKDFYIVEKGDKGGFIESEENLSHFNNCWVYYNARVSNNAVVSGNAVVSSYAKIASNSDYIVFKNW